MIAYIGAHPKRDEDFFALNDWGPRTILKTINGLAKQRSFGIGNFNSHLLKDTWISCPSEITDRTAMLRIVGYSDFRTTKGYTHIDELKKRGIATNLETRLSAIIGIE